jgi:phosphoglycolate phosphatase-like HAD superfamily hydrolase
MPTIWYMGQHGADTVIGRQVRLLICDCFETLVQHSGEGYVARAGVPVFLDHFVSRLGLPLAVCSDASYDAVSEALTQAKLLDWADHIFGVEVSGERLENGLIRKRLDVVVAHYGMPLGQIVFIGDSPLDAQAAHHHQVSFIRVPRSEDEDFDFTQLIAGPSRYDSAEFSSTMLDFYMKQRGVKDD